MLYSVQMETAAIRQIRQTVYPEVLPLPYVFPYGFPYASRAVYSNNFPRSLRVYGLDYRWWRCRAIGHG